MKNDTTPFFIVITVLGIFLIAIATYKTDVPVHKCNNAIFLLGHNLGDPDTVYCDQREADLTTEVLNGQIVAHCTCRVH